MRRRIDIACGLVVRPEVVFLDEPTTGLDPRSRQAIWELVTTFKEAGIATLLTTQYLEEADALSDRIIVIDHGTIVAQGTADELKERTGGTYCEIVPRDPADLHAMVEALGPLLPATSRAAISPESDRVSLPAPDGPAMLTAALWRLNSANIELADIALRRPSLDDVFLSLTGDSAQPEPPTAWPVRCCRDRLDRGEAGPVHRATVVGADDAADRSHAAQRRGGGGHRRIGGGDGELLHPA